MRKSWLLIAIGLLIALLAVAAIACDGDDDDDGDAGDGGGVVATLTATLAEVGGNGVTGGAVLTEADDGTTVVVVTLTGLPEGPHANHLHHGTCDAQGEVHVTLEELQASADGDATATTSGFPSDPEDPGLDHFAAGHYVAVHEAGNDTVGAVISCGNVE